MNTKKLSLLAVLALSSGFLRADILDLEYTKSDLAAVEKTAGIIGSCKEVYELFQGEIAPEGSQVDNAFTAVNYLDDITEQALESGHNVSTIKRLAGALNKAKKTLSRNDDKEKTIKWETKDYAKMAAALGFGVAQELAHGHVIKTIKKHFASPKQRLYRRGLYVGKDVLLEGIFNAIETFVANKFDNKEVELWQSAKEAMLDKLVKTLAVQIIGEVLVSMTEDDNAAPEVLKAEQFMDKLSNPIL